MNASMWRPAKAWRPRDARLIRERHFKPRLVGNRPAGFKQQAAWGGAWTRFGEESPCPRNEGIIRAGKKKSARLQGVVLRVPPRKQHAQLRSGMAQDSRGVGVAGVAPLVVQQAELAAEAVRKECVGPRRFRDKSFVERGDEQGL